MKALLTILALVLVAPVLLLVAIALGPAILVILFIAGIALMVMALVWFVERTKSRHTRRTPVPPLHP
jgi:Na+-driven multidrug efflux pump